MNRNCSACNIKIDINNYKKDRTVCKSCHNKNKRKYNIMILTPNYQQPNIVSTNCIVSTYKNRANVAIGRRNVGKTFYMLKVLEKTGTKRTLHIISRSPNQYPNCKTSTEIKTANKYKGSVVFLTICWELKIVLK